MSETRSIEVARRHTPRQWAEVARGENAATSQFADVYLLCHADGEKRLIGNG